MLTTIVQKYIIHSVHTRRKEYAHCAKTKLTARI